jgi:hypothetical protein
MVQKLTHHRLPGYVTRTEEIENACKTGLFAVKHLGKRPKMLIFRIRHEGATYYRAPRLLLCYAVTILMLLYNMFQPYKVIIR